MAFLELRKLESIKFGDFELLPKMDREQQLRVKNLKVSEDNLEEVQDVLSACFGVDAGRVKEFMQKNMFLQDYSALKIYLAEGPSGLESYQKRMDKFMAEAMDKVMTEQLEKMEKTNG